MVKNICSDSLNMEKVELVATQSLYYVVFTSLVQEDALHTTKHKRQLSHNPLIYNGVLGSKKH